MTSNITADQFFNESARAQWRRVADQLRPELPKVAVFLDEAETDVLAYMDFQPRIGPSCTRRMRSTSDFFMAVAPAP